ncbi:M48 family metalloprotease [Saccharothrix xinjiangensis]|uniref:M48 family metalloprotease n=1 Tax=Saccharothrix xinjiangensis TaxID=204798 RepID=A0ABV9Y5L5_9PSEU
MTTGTASPPTDERVMGTGTTVRFALLMVLMVAASGALMHDVLSSVSGSSGRGCELAGGVDPDAGTLQVQLVLAQQLEAYFECMDRYQPAPPWWAVFGWPVAVLLGAVLLFRLIPASRLRFRRLVPLEAVDRDGTIGLAVAAATAEAGLDRVPRVVVEPLSGSTGAVVFGSNRRPVLRLSGGLLTRLTTRPEHFRSVVLHELAHIRHGDITLTYATIALWRVFVGLVLLPYAVWTAMTLFRDTWWSSDQPFGVRGVLLAVLMVLLVHLARLDVLRSREVHADVAAARWGAAHSTWAATPQPATPQPATPQPTVPPEPAGRLRRAAASFTELWRTHPRLDLRRAALADPGALLGVRGLPVFLTGIAATLVNSQLGAYVERYLARGGPLLDWVTRALPLIPAGLVVGVVGFALWRAEEHAAATSRPAPSGALVGLWLGGGLASGELFLNRVAIAEWVPAHPEALLLVVAAGVAVTWWTGQCARLWAAVWRGRAARWAVVAALGAAWLALASWLTWWRDNGVAFASGWPLGTGQVRAVLTEGLGEAAARYGDVVSAFAAVYPVLHGLSAPVLPAAVGALWVVPLLAWAVRPPDGTPRWLRSALDGTGAVAVGDAALPPLRRALLPGLLGGALACAAVVGVQAHLHTWRPLPPGEGALFALTYQVWLFVALVGGTVVAAVAAARTGRHRLVVTVIAAETAAVVGFAGVLVLTSVDGCVEPLRTLETTCGPHFTAAGFAVDVTLVPLVVIGALVAFAVAAVAEAVRRARGRATVPRAHRNPRALTGRRRAVAVLCAAAVAIAASGVVLWHRGVGEHTAGGSMRLFASAADRPVDARTRAAQAYAWLHRGGEDLNRRIADNSARQLAVLREAASNGGDVSSLLPVCAEFGRIARDAQRYFRVPDARAQERWATFVDQATRGSGNCAAALEQPDGPGARRLLLQSLDQLNGSVEAAGATLGRITEIVGG